MEISKDFKYNNSFAYAKVMPLDSSQQTSFMSKRKAGTMYFADKKFVPRIKEVSNFCKGAAQFLEGTNHKGFDVENVVDHLRETYPEYGRRKKHALRLSVLKVLNNISTKSSVVYDKTQQLEDRYLSKRQRRTCSDDNREKISDSDSDSCMVDGEELIEYKDSNITNTFMQDLYKRNTKTTLSATAEKTVLGNEKNESTVPVVSNVSHSAPVSPVAVKKSFVPVNSFQEEDSIEISTKKEIVYSDLPLNRASLNPISEDEKSNVSRPGTPLNKSTTKLARRKSEASKQKKFESSISTVSFKDIGGCDSCLQEVCKLLLHLKHPEIFTRLGVKPPRGFLLHGAPGCGKTLLANAIAGELQVPFFKISAPEVVSGISGESEQKIRTLFNQAMAVAPSIIFIDEIDSITPKRESAGKEMERRVVTQILTCMDDLASADSHVLVIGATNRVDALDPSLRRAGRFDREIAMGIPDKTSRKKILEVICRPLRLSDDFDYDLIASLTPGFVGADIQALAREAALNAINKVFQSLDEEQPSISVPNYPAVSEDSMLKTQNRTDWLQEQPPLSDDELSKLFIKTEHFQSAIPHVQPSAKREGFATVPDVTWNDIGALENVREELTMAIMAPVQNPEEFASLGLVTPPGILLAGPPGCGKTLLAKAIANEAGINFISVKGPELLNMYVGESEKAVRQVFQRARTSSPCVIFFDEIDALCPRRSLMGDSTASSRVVNQLLTEMDGLETRKQVFIMAATNRPDILDNAILRPGRLDKLLYVGLPNTDDRVKILKTITKNGTKPLLGNDVTVESLAANEKCRFFSGADLTALVREASITALKEYMKEREMKAITRSVVVVCNSHFEVAFDKVKPSVSEKDRVWYNEMEQRYGKLK